MILLCGLVLLVGLGALALGADSIRVGVSGYMYLTKQKKRIEQDQDQGEGEGVDKNRRVELGTRKGGWMDSAGGIQ